MSCTAKLPIYALFTAAFFPEHAGLVMAAIYVFGILMAIVMASVLKRTLFTGQAVPFVMELPNYRMPGWRNVGLLLWDKAKDFLQRAFSLIFVASIVIWFLNYFDLHLQPVSNSQDSIMAALAGGLVQIMQPLGLGDWRIVTALISGLMAKESVVATITVLFGDTATLLATLTPLAALAMLTFCLFYTPCVAAVASIKRELGWSWTVGVVLGQCVVAWLAAFAVVQLGVLCGWSL